MHHKSKSNFDQTYPERVPPSASRGFLACWSQPALAGSEFAGQSGAGQVKARAMRGQLGGKIAIKHEESYFGEPMNIVIDSNSRAR